MSQSALPDRKEQLVLRDRKVLAVRKVPRVLRALRGYQDLPEQPGHKGPPDRALTLC